MAPKFVPKPPIEKLPLAVRKDYRDKYEANKSDWEAKIAELLGFPLTFNFDLNAVWAYSQDNAPTAGYICGGYVEGLISALERFVDKFGDTGRAYIKNAVTTGEVRLAVNDKKPNETIDGDVRDGVYYILFGADRLGSNQGYQFDELTRAINRVPYQGFTLLAKHSMETVYEPEIDEVREHINEILNSKEVVLEPNFEALYAALQKREDPDWQRVLGDAALGYFRDGVASQLERQGFKGDEMLQEGFFEGVPSKTIKLRIVDKIKSGEYSEAVIEDGVLYIQTTVDRWWSNISDAGQGILDLL
ncbi:hypothetical protein D9619_007900 [Psilocybe cf. subviscida]|uniref:Uncharacterized protein n=1 Tax=Psilocybe cf. subviscida TaxID=2480587 RepID=A0A8H5ESQ5_9AGAR|nr:hypothetical protein D9619_007900 [Psilocybe cf. subviscida]